MNKKSLAFKKSIALAVVFVHTILCAYIFMYKPAAEYQPSSGAIAVHHKVFVQPTKPAPKSIPKVSTPTKVTSQVKSDLKKVDAKKTVVPSAKKEPQDNQTKSKPPKKPIASSSTSSQNKPSRVLSQRGIPKYTLELQSFLKSHLKLKQKGRVVVRLTLGQKGNVIDLKVSSATDEVLIKPLEDQLKKLQFPAFTDELKGEKKHTFTFEFY